MLVRLMVVEGRRGRTYPFPVAVFAFSICFVQVDAIEATDCEREDELDKAEDGMGDISHSHLAAANETHFACWRYYLQLCFRAMRRVLLKSMLCR